MRTIYRMMYCLFPWRRRDRIEIVGGNLIKTRGLRYHGRVVVLGSVVLF